MEKLVKVVAGSHVYIWEQMTPGLDKNLCVTIKNGNVLITSITTGLLKIMSAEFYVNRVLGPMLVQNIICSNYIDGWATGRRYSIDKIVSSDESDYEVEPLLQKFVTLVKACASESIKNDSIYNISFRTCFRNRVES